MPASTIATPRYCRPSYLRLKAIILNIIENGIIDCDRMANIDPGKFLANSGIEVKAIHSASPAHSSSHLPRPFTAKSQLSLVISPVFVLYCTTVAKNAM